MTQIRRHIVLSAMIAAAAAFSGRTFAQATPEWLLVELGGGLHNIQYSPQDSDRSPGFGSMLDVKYMRHLNKVLSLSGGIGFANYGALAKYDMADKADDFDTENNQPYTLITNYKGFVEKLNLYQVEIPVGATYRINHFLSYADLYLGLGLKFGIPVASNYKLKKGEFQMTGYYPSTGEEYGKDGDLEHHGFVTMKADKQTGKTNVAGFNMSVYGEMMIHKSLNRNMEFCGGLYFGYCPLNIAKPDDVPVVSRNTTDCTYNGTLNSNQVDKAHLATIGLKAALMMDFRRLFHISSASKF